MFDGIGGKEICKKSNMHWACWWDVAIEKELEEDGAKYKGLLMAVKSWHFPL